MVIVLAPHPDDELIGCYEIVSDRYKDVLVWYCELVDTPLRKDHSTLLLNKSLVREQQFLNSSIDRMFSLLSEIKGEKMLLAPDPYFETHPDHRKWGAAAEEYLRMGNDVMFYSTNMQAPYIHKVKRPAEKKELLDFVYPEQSSMWRYDHRYFLFEGRCKWIMN